MWFCFGGWGAVLAQEATYDFEVPETSADIALSRIAEQSGTLILFPFDRVNQIEANEVEGELTIADALHIALEDTGLSASLSEDGVIIVSLAPDHEPIEGNQVQNRIARSSLLASTAALVWGGIVSSVTAQETTEEVSAQDIIVVTGTRSANRTALETAVPVDVFPVGELTQSGRVELNQILAATVPSFNFNQTAINDGTDIIRPATLRGLQPDQTLVLLNSKRRHQSALVNINGSVGRGSAAVDLNAIPTSAIGEVQVLRDGASAQYGSDAIAGVINVLLREADSGGGATFRYGAHVTDPDELSRSIVDGETLTLGGWIGLPLTADGYLTISAEYKDRSATNRAGPDPRQQYAEIEEGILDPRELTFDRINHRFGNGEAEDINLFVNAGVNLSEDMEVYGWAGYQDREADSAGFYRRSLDSRNIVEIYPDGFLPKIGGDVTDLSVGGGLRGEAAGWGYDASIVYGSNELDYSVFNSLNVSLGPTSQTVFDAGALLFDQLTVNGDVVRTFDTLLPGTTTVAFGAEFRTENFEIQAGEENSYILGPFDGAAGSQVFPGFTPASEVDESRDAVGVYGDIEWEPSEQLLFSGALRYEDYSDFGDALTGKVTGRYDITDSLALRGAISTGFRAPSLQQQFFTAISTNFIDGVPFEVGTFAATSAPAVALGGGQLDAEESISYSIGTVLRPTPEWFVTIDAYQIEIDDQIFLTENLGGDDVDAALAAAGVTGVDRVRFFQNGIETETTGIDIVTRYDLDLGEAGALGLSAAFNYSEVEVTEVPQNAVIPDLTLFSRDRQLTFEEAAPETKFVLTGDWDYSVTNVVFRATHYGDVVDPSNTPSNDFTLEADWILDLSVDVELTDNFRIGVGGDNILDTYPTATPSNQNFNGIFPFSSRSPYGFSGRFLYFRAAYDW